ncbi:MAG: hypothetical protein KAT75_04280 [Dehalococcoidia bacterium]|nr:hypothetical protein [Dehalococcoidia bacterium]
MPNGKSDVMAQAVYLAQLEAAKNNCKCTTCRILRKATRTMTEQFLSSPGGDSPGAAEVLKAARVPEADLVNVEDEED